MGQSDMNEELRLLLNGISPGAIGFFILILPRLKEGTPYGFCDETIEDLGHELRISISTVGKYMKELRRKNIIKHSRRGIFYSPIVVKRIL